VEEKEVAENGKAKSYVDTDDNQADDYSSTDR
jgi:hypothetical protein